MFPAFAIDEDTLSAFSALLSDAQRREKSEKKAQEKRLGYARRIRHFVEQEYIAYKQADSNFNALLFIKRMRDLEDDLFLIFLLIFLEIIRANSHPQEQPSVIHIPQNSNAPKPSRKMRPPKIAAVSG